MSIDNEKLRDERPEGDEDVRIEIAPEEENEIFGQQTVFVSDEVQYDDSKPLFTEGVNEKKAQKRKKRMESGRPARVSNYKAQTRWICILLVSAIVLGLAYYFVDAFVKTIVFIDEADGTKYYIKRKDNPDYDPSDSSSLKKLYFLCDEEGYTLTKTPDNYYSTKAGTLVEVDGKTGEYEIIAVVDTEGNEQLSNNRRLLMFPHTEREKIRSIEVHNEYGTYTFYRDDSLSFSLKGYDGVVYDSELMAYLVTSTGYTLTTNKVKDPIKDENGAYTEYGLAPQTRIDEDGNEYEYVPAYYILTDIYGTVHKVTVGDKMITDEGYYVQYEGRDAVYTVSNTIAKTVLEPIETFITPIITTPMSMNDYFDVENFTVMSFNYDRYNATGGVEPVVEKTHTIFTYIPIAERENTVHSSYPYVMGVDIDGKPFMEGYTPSPAAVDDCLQMMLAMTPLRTVRLGLDDDGVVLKRYGLDEPAYIISYTHTSAETESSPSVSIPNLILISKKTEQGTYYATSMLYDMVVEVPESQLLFLEYDDIDWVDENVLSINVGLVDKIKVESEKGTVDFELDNSRTDVSDGIASDRLHVSVSQSGKQDQSFIWGVEITDSRGFKWIINHKSIEAYDKSGTQVGIKGLYTATNKHGVTVQVVNGTITDSAGNSISLTADQIIMRDYNGVETVHERGAIHNFRQFYKVLLITSISGDATEEASEETLAALRALDDSECQLKLTISFTNGTTRVYRFYKLTERKSYLTINGEGHFFSSSTMVEKIISDAQKVVDGISVDADSKY